MNYTQLNVHTKERKLIRSSLNVHAHVSIYYMYMYIIQKVHHTVHAVPFDFEVPDWLEQLI